MNYQPYPAYDFSVAATGISFPGGWPVERLRFSILSNPVRSEVAHWDDETAVSFVPMDAVGEQGEIDPSQEKQLADVYNGYTYFLENDILIAKITPCFENGKGAIARGLKNGVGFGTTEFHVLRPLQGMSERWLFYLTKCDFFRKIGGSEMLGAGGQKRLPEEFIRNLRVGIPSFSEQERIADFLDWKTGQIDALIAKKQALIEKLKEKRLAVITQAVTKGIDQAAPLKDSNLPFFGKIPGHWAIGKLARGVERIEQGWSPSCEDRQATEDEWGVLKSGCVNGGNFRQDDNKTLPADLLPIESLEVKPGDILMCRASGSRHFIGSVAFVDECRQRLMFSDKTYRIRTEREVLDDRFFVLAMRSKAMRDQIELSISGAEGLANNIPQSAVKSYVFAYPPLREQVAIVAYLNALLARISAIENTVSCVLEKLTEYRTALITAATTGQIDVRNVAIPAQA